MNERSVFISPRRFDAVIFDMDGVVTRTAGLHAAAWKEMFDHFLAQYGADTETGFRAFDPEADYLRYVDGKPRYDGVRDFLASREIELPEGEPGDDPGEETVCGLGNRKDRLFRQLLEERGVTRYESTVDLIHRLERAGIRTAVITSSRNGRRVLAAAGVAELFAVRLDGNDAAQLELRGKPEPDIFLEAARQLQVTPARAVVIEDARSGVRAGRRGGFGLVIGVDRGGQEQQLARDADVVVPDLAALEVEDGGRSVATAELPSALERLEEIVRRLDDRRPAVFLDYDGTLTPIVPRPEDARISAKMRASVTALAERCPVAVVSGRDLQDVRKMVGIPGIYYAGSHGFDIAGPGGEQDVLQQGTEYLPALDRAEAALTERLAAIEGAQVERKKFALAVHFRRVAEQRRAEVEKAVDAVLERTEGLRKTGGKMIFELRPDIDWDKGKALHWLLRKLDLDGPGVVPVYIGDDLTDEDALRVVAGPGIGILVRDGKERITHAAYGLDRPEEVGLFLRRLAEELAAGGTA